MHEIRIWISSEESINIVTNVGTAEMTTAIRKYKTNVTSTTAIDLESYLKGWFASRITIIPREVEEIEYSEV